MKRKMKQVLSGLLSALMVLGMCNTFTMSAYASSHTKALDHPTITPISKTGETDVNYSFSFAANEKSIIEPFGNTGKVVSTTSDAKSISGGYDYYDAKWIMPSNSENGKVGFWVRNVGLYKGNVIDLKITYTWINKVSSDGLEYKPSIGLTLCKDGKIGMNFNTRAYEANAEIYSNGQKTTIDKLSFTFGDIDDFQFFGFKPIGDIKDIQCSEDSTVYYKKINDMHFMYASAGGFPDTPNASLRFELDNVSGYEFVIGKDNAYGDYGLTNNEDGFTTMPAFDPDSASAKYWYNIWANYFDSWSDTITETKLIDDLMAQNQGYAWGYFTGYSYSQYGVSPPEKSITDENEVDVVSNTLERTGEAFTYKILHFVPFAWEEFYFDSYTITDELPDCLEVKVANVKVFDTADIDVTTKFNIKVEGQKLSVEAKAEELAKDTFYAQTYKVAVDTRIKNDADMQPFYDDKTNTVEFTNKAIVVIDGRSTDSNTVRTRVPEVENEIVKSIILPDGSKVTELTLNNRDEDILFQGDIAIANMKNPVSVVLEDELHEAFKYKEDSLQVLNAEGEDITEHGEVTVDGQLVRFAFSEEYASTLANNTLTWRIVANYIGDEMVETKIPNTMNLIVDGKGILSPPVIITPPEVENEIVKSIILPDGSKVAELTLNHGDEEILFQGDITIANTNNLTSVVLEDELHEAFKYKEDSLQVLNAEGEDITEHGEIEVDGQLVRFVFNEEYASTLANHTLTWRIVTNYIGNEMVETKIPNIMNLIVDGKEILSPPVIITPPEVENEIVKSIILPDGSKVTELVLIDENEEILFQGDITIANTNNLTSVVLEDELHEAFQYKEDSLQVLTAEGEDITEHGEIEVDGQLVRFIFNEEYASTLANHTLTWRIVANYIGGEIAETRIPNIMTLFVDEEKIDSPPVVVFPPIPDDVITKSIVLVEGNEVDEHMVKNDTEEVLFRGRVIVFDRKEEVTSVVLQDELHKAFQYKEDSLQVLNAEGEDITEHGEIKVDGQLIQFTFHEDYIQNIVGTRLSWELTVILAKEADMSELQDGKIPNTMQLIVNEETLSSNEVVVTKEEVILDPPKESETPKTGLENRMLLYAGIGIVLLGIGIAFFVKGKKKTIDNWKI